MFRYYKKNIRWALPALLLGVAVTCFTPVSAVLEQKLIDYIVQGNMEGFRKMLWYVALIVLASGGTCYLNAMAGNKFKSRFTEDLRNDLYDSIMRKGYAAYGRHDTAEYMSAIENDVDTVTNNFTSPIWSLAGAGSSIVLSLAVMASYSPLLTVVAVGCSLLSFCVPVIITRHLKKSLVEKSVREAALTVQIKEALNGHEVVSAFGVFGTVRKRFAEANMALTNAIYRLAIWISVLESSSRVVGSVVKFLTFFIAGTIAIQGRISIGTVVLFVSLYGYFNSYVMLFSQIVPLLRSSRPIICKLTAMIDEREEHPGCAKPSFTDEIRVEHLCFQYKEGFPVLNKLELTLHKGEKLALVGASGCGKSTFIRLLSGDYEDYLGGIYYDAVEMRELDHHQLRKLVTVIHQNTYIFNDTIRYNICLGEAFTDSELDNALRLSGVDQFLPDITDGLDGNCGEDGAGLSGGQKQRIALARALIRGVDFLILDEGVSAIDVETANKIEQELLDMENLTLLTITHRLRDGLLHRYDKVLVMEDGKMRSGRWNK